ncbi:MAG: hypothetical protein NVSMB29_07410 [Candidatus Dormibacteria bacterium]
MNPTPTPSLPEDELLDQWSFLDSMVERQASALRSGAQDTEETDPLPVEVSAPDELGVLRRLVVGLERERDALRAQLEGRGREIERAEQHSADLMRSLREAHAAVEHAQQVSAAAEQRAAAAEEAVRAGTAQPSSTPPHTAGSRSSSAEGSEPRRRSAIFANEDPPPPTPKPSFIDRLLGRR